MTATDVAGNTASRSCTYSVTYRFEGFREPITPGTINTIKSGRTVPVTWRITDANGTPISDPASFVSLTTVAGSCTTGLANDEIEVTSTGSGLSYQGNGVWQYHWKTTGLTGCRTLNLRLAGGTTPHSALFNIRP